MGSVVPPAAAQQLQTRVAALLGDLGQQLAQLVEGLAVAAELVAETAQNGGQGTAGQSPDGSG